MWKRSGWSVFVERRVCNNASDYGMPVFNPACFSGKPRHLVILDNGDGVHQHFELCPTCYKSMRADVRRYKYIKIVSTRKIKETERPAPFSL